MNTPEQELAQAIAVNDAERVIKICNSGHRLDEYIRGGPRTRLGSAVSHCSAKLIEAMLDAGFDINILRLPERSTPLSTAIGFDQDEVVELLLRRGADVSIGRPLIGALNPRKTAERRLRYVKLLVSHGVDVNQRYDLFGDPNKQFTALDWTKDPAVIEYLRSRGAKT